MTCIPLPSLRLLPASHLLKGKRLQDQQIQALFEVATVVLYQDSHTTLMPSMHLPI
jgi:hypothetical protein